MLANLAVTSLSVSVVIKVASIFAQLVRTTKYDFPCCILTSRAFKCRLQGICFLNYFERTISASVARFRISLPCIMYHFTHFNERRKKNPFAQDQCTQLSLSLSLKCTVVVTRSYVAPQTG